MTRAEMLGERILVLLTHSNDAERTVEVLAEAGLQGVAIEDMTELCHRLNEGAGAVLLSEEMIFQGAGCLQEALKAQPSWSTIPLLVVVEEGVTADRHESLLSDLEAHVTIIERPVHLRPLVSVVRSAVRARKHQYAVRDALVDRELALEAARLGWWRYDPETKVANFDRRYCDIFGVTGVQKPNEEILKLIHPDDLLRVLEAVDAALNPLHPQPYSIEYRVIRPDGEQRWVEARGTVEFEGEGTEQAATSFVGTVADITARKRSDEQLRRNHETFFNLVQNSPYGVCVMDADFRLLQLSAGAQRVFSGVVPLLGRDFAEVLRAVWAEPFATEAISRFRNTLTTGEPYSAPTTTERRRDNGIQESYDWRIERIVLPDGTFGVVCYFYDLTDLRRIEASLRQSEERFRLLAESIPNLAWMARPDGHVFWYNRQWYEYTGTTLEDMEGWGWQSVHDPAVLPEALKRWKRSIENSEPFSMVFPLKGADGEFRPFLTLVNPFCDENGTVSLWFGTNTDISEQKEVEAILKRSEQRFRDIADASPAMLWLTDPSGTCTFLSRRWCEFTGHEAEAPSSGRTDATHPNDRPHTTQQFHAANIKREPFLAEYRLKSAEGNYRWVVDIGRPWYDANGDYLGMVGAVFDVDDRKRAEDEVRQSDRRKDHFLATLAHELRNPLAPISYVLQTWSLTEADKQKTDQMRGLMERQVRQLVRLIDDLLDVSRISRGKIELRKQQLDLSIVIQSALEAVRPFVESCQHELTVTLPSKPITLNGDPGRLMQVIGNLVHNAAKYTGRDGHIWLSALREGKHAAIRIRDDGPGIPADMLTNVFEMFTQVDQTLTRSYGGLGIGLTLVKTLVELHGGSVEAKSDGTGTGSEFIVRLPAELDGEATIDNQSKNTYDRSATPARRVLVVDDVQPSADTLSLILNSLGQKTRTAYDGQTALALLEDFKPDVVFLDVAMPGMDGYQVARRIREGTSAYPVLVALTGYGQEEDRKRAFEAGFDHHLVKPTTVDALHEVLMKVPGLEHPEPRPSAM